MPRARLSIALALALAAAMMTSRSRFVPPGEAAQVKLASPASTELFGPAAPTLLPPGFVWTQAHDEALDLDTTAKARALGLFEFLAGGPRTFNEITRHMDQYKPTFSWSSWQAGLRGLVNDGLAEVPDGELDYPHSSSLVLLTPYGRRVFQALGEIPETVKEYAWCWNWTRSYCPDWYYPLPPP